MKLYASRYWSDSKNYDIVCYKSEKLAKECPHDYEFQFTPAEWRKMKCRVPKGKYPANDYSPSDEVMVVELTAKEKV